MFWDDGPDTRTPIEKYFDDLGYFAHRDIVYNARKGTLKKEYPLIQFSAQEILRYAHKDCENSTIPGASCNGLDGASNYTALMGEPEINPLTLEKNSIEDQSGLIEDGLKHTEEQIKKVIYTVAILGAGYLILKPMAESWAKKL